MRDSQEPETMSLAEAGDESITDDMAVAAAKAAQIYAARLRGASGGEFGKGESMQGLYKATKGMV